MRKTTYVQYLISIIVIGIILGFASCKKEDSIIGFNLLNPSEKFDFFCDSIKVDCYTTGPDKILIDYFALSPLGSYIDPTFGFSKASVFFQVDLPSSNVSFESVETIESLELHLKIISYYGDSITPQTLHINRILTDLPDTLDYTDYSLEAGEYSLLETATISYNDADTAGIIKLRLPEDLARSFIDPANKDHFTSDEAFKKFFKGFYLTTEDATSGGCIYSIALTGRNSQLVLNYNDSLAYAFNITSESSAIMKSFEHDYSNASQDLINAIDNFENVCDYSYIQAMAGVKTMIKIPNLKNILADSTNIAINRAKLYLSVAENTEENKYEPPSRLAVYAKNDDGKLLYISDMQVNPNVDGEYKNHTYSFNISLYLQRLLSNSGADDYTIYIAPRSERNLASPHRTVIIADSEKENGPKLEIYYSLY